MSEESTGVNLRWGELYLGRNYHSIETLTLTLSDCFIGEQEMWYSFGYLQKNELAIELAVSQLKQNSLPFLVQ